MLEESCHLDIESRTGKEARSDRFAVLPTRSNVNILTSIVGQRDAIDMIVLPQPDWSVTERLDFGSCYRPNFSRIGEP